MQLGLTIPLQRKLKIKQLDYGESMDRLYCWDLHCITLRGRSSLLVVHCATRYTFVVFDMTVSDWNRVSDIVMEYMEKSLVEAGLSEEKVQQYLESAGEPELTKTHGRREVAFLNRAWDDVMTLDGVVNQEEQDQPFLNQAVNGIPCRCVGSEERVSALEHLRVMFAESCSCY